MGCCEYDELKNYRSRQQETGENIEEISGCERLKWVNKWPNSMRARLLLLLLLLNLSVP